MGAVGTDPGGLRGSPDCLEQYPGKLLQGSVIGQYGPRESARKIIEQAPRPAIRREEAYAPCPEPGSPAPDRLRYRGGRRYRRRRFCRALRPLPAPSPRLVAGGL